MRVSPLWQCVATLFLPSGFYAFKRINKLRKGILVYIASLGISLISLGLVSLLFINNHEQSNILIEIYILGTTALSFYLPMYFIRKWSIEWNKKIGKENITSVV